jgi:riboflavin kinase/FMN adenylyltransferase
MPYKLLEQGSVATIGSYDGIHLGHQKLLDRVLAVAAEKNLPSVVMSFEPTPKEYFAGDSPPARLMRFREKYESLRDYGVDIFFCPRFDDQMRKIEADTFIRQLLIQSLNIKHLVIGDDFQFARARSGGLPELQRAGAALDFSVEQLPSVISDGERVSSTAIRDALWRGDLGHATRLLGRPYRMSGRVLEGKHLGRELGFPTANVALQRKQSAVMGIFAVQVCGIGSAVLNGVASIGTRPTVEGTIPLLEVHIFDFDTDIYGKTIHVDFIARLRSEEKFPDLPSLVNQMHKDAAQARAILAA